MKKVGCILFLTLALTACGGSGGGTSGPSAGSDLFGCTDSIATNFNPSATINDGSCSYGGVTNDGETATLKYKGFSTSDASEVTLDMSVDSEPSAFTNIVISNELIVEVVDRDTRSLKAQVYEPNCAMGGATDYSVILVKGSGITAKTLSLSFFAMSAQIKDHSFKYALTGGVYSAFRQDTATIDLTFSCAAGKITTNDGSIIFANGKSIVMKQGSNIYLGIAQSNLRNPLSMTLASYNQIDAGGFSVGAGVGSSSTFSSGGGDQNLNSVGSISATTANIYFASNAGLRVASNDIGSYDYSHHSQIMPSSGAGRAATALIADYASGGGFFVAVTGQCCALDSVNAGFEICTGAGGIVIGKEN